MENPLTNDLKFVRVTNRLTEGHIIIALEAVALSVSGTHAFCTNSYSLKYVFKYLRETFPTLPIATLLQHSGLFKNEHIPGELMLEERFAFQLSDHIVFLKTERAKNQYYISESGLLFLKMALNAFRRDIDKQLFYLSR